MAITFEKPADVEADDVEPGEETTGADSPAPAGLLAQLRPYLPTRYVAGALCSGSVVLSGRVWDWATAGGWKAARGRLAGLGLTGYVAAYEEAHGQTWVLPVVCGAWTVGALLLSPAKASAAAEKQEEDQDLDVDIADDETDDSPGVRMLPLDADLVARTVREIAADLGWLGVHLDDLLVRLPGRSREELLACLADAGIAVHPGFKLRFPGGVQKNRRGVRLDALPAGLGETPPTPAPTPAPGLRSVPSQAPAAGPPNPSPPPTPDPLQKAG